MPGTYQQDGLPLDGAAQVRGQALVLFLEVLDQVVQSLEEDLLHSCSRLTGQEGRGRLLGEMVGAV